MSSQTETRLVGEGTRPVECGYHTFQSTTHYPYRNISNLKIFSINEKQLFEFSRHVNGATLQNKLAAAKDVSLVLPGFVCAQYEECAADFQSNVLTAGQEVPDALYSYRAAGNKTTVRTMQLTLLQQSVDYTTELLKYDY